MSLSRQDLGRWGEDQAEQYLLRRGYAIVGRNVRTRYGEIDLVARQESASGAATVFVEVKTRRSAAYGLPEEAVTARKQAHLLAAAQSYLQAHPELDGDWRVDVIAIRKERAGQAAEITHFENAVT